MSTKPAIVWVRDILRLCDHPALQAALADGPVVFVYVLDDAVAGRWAPASASRWWLHQSLGAFQTDVEARGGTIVLRRGDTVAQIVEICAGLEARGVFFTRAYEPYASAQEAALKQALEKIGVACRRFGGRLLMEPEQVRTQNGDPYKVYTPFWRSLAQSVDVGRTRAAPDHFDPVQNAVDSDRLEDFGLLPTRPNWAEGWDEFWTPGEVGARARLAAFLDDGLNGYATERDRPDHAGTSRLSPHLHFGEISPAAVWRAAAGRQAESGALDKDRETFLKEVVWREFSYHLMFHFPHMPDSAFKPKFNDFPWKQGAEADLEAWQRGQTGYPIVDAGMRELWHTGWMHNRVRMIVASFLIKHLLVPWQEGEKWFWDTLVDADLASNAAGWQWVAGSGADASPYFRIFNPMTQGEKFDPNGDYVRKWVPELAKLPNKIIHAPFEAEAKVLAYAGVTLGETYPKPLVDHKLARERALKGYAQIKG